MSNHRADRIGKPPYFAIRHLRMGRSARKPYVIGFDSEAHSCSMLGHKRCDENGYPFLYQFAHPDGSCDLVLVPRTGKPHETLWTFIDHLYKQTQRKDTEYIVVGYNLDYEYTQLFRDLDDVLKNAPEFALGIKPNEPCLSPGGHEFYIIAMNMKRYSFTIEWAKTKRRVRVIDGMAFIAGGLDGAGKLIGAGAKLPKPERFDRENALHPDMRAYATQDAILTQKLGEWIVDLHARYDVTQCVSAPHFASKVYKRAYLETEIPLVDGDLEQDGLRAYHGGKNGFYLPKPFRLKGVYHVDIRSAYPEAMRQLPDPERSEFVYSDEYVPNAHAIWNIVGRYKRCKYRGLMTDAEWPRSGTIRASVTGYELDAALEHGEIELVSCSGWVMVGPEGGSLASYVDDFYAMKRDAKTTAEKLAAKLFLNSLYGKFFQKVEQGNVGSIVLGTGEIVTTDPMEEFDYIAGGLYHPPIAALITGFVRAKIHRLEHDYDSIMTSTDGFFSRKPPADELLGKELGMLSCERGTLTIWRERVYIFDPDKPEHLDDCKPTCNKPHPVYAMHGYIGTVDTLRTVPLTAGLLWEYEAKRVIGLRASTRRMGGERYRPGEFVMQSRHMQMPGTGPPT